jgi:antitoxin PrlF
MNANLYAMRMLQEEMQCEFEKTGINNEEDIIDLVREIRTEIEGSQK